jgi:hypothetical protein
MVGSKKKKILFFNLIKCQYLWHTINLTSSCSAKQVRWPKSLFFFFIEVTIVFLLITLVESLFVSKLS